MMQGDGIQDSQRIEDCQKILRTLGEEPTKSTEQRPAYKCVGVSVDIPGHYPSGPKKPKKELTEAERANGLKVYQDFMQDLKQRKKHQVTPALKKVPRLVQCSLDSLLSAFLCTLLS